MQLYNCYLAYQAYSQLDQEIKDTLLLLRDKLNQLAIQENDERITALAEEFSTQIDRISSEDTSWMKTYAEELIEDDMFGFSLPDPVYAAAADDREIIPSFFCQNFQLF